MNTFWKAVCISGAITFAPLAFAEESPAPAADPAVLQLQAVGDQVVKVSTGNEVVDAVSNLAVKCAERSTAFKACDSMGGFKAMGCRKMAEFRYKDVQCPL